MQQELDEVVAKYCLQRASNDSFILNYYAAKQSKEIVMKIPQISLYYSMYDYLLF